MKHKHLSITAAFLLAVTLSFISCKKGTQGPAGTANVIYSDWLVVNFAADTIHSGATIDTVDYYATITATKLDSTVLNKGDVKVYVNVGTSSSPTVAEVSAIGLTTVLTSQKITLIGGPGVPASDQYSTYTPAGGSQTYLYRYVLIPGGVKASSSVNWNNYQEAKQATGMKD